MKQNITEQSSPHSQYNNSGLQLSELPDVDSIWGGVYREAHSQEGRQKHRHKKFAAAGTYSKNKNKESPGPSRININPHSKGLCNSMPIAH